MLILKTAILYIILIFIFYRVGIITQKWIKSNNLIHIILYGFALTAGILEIVYVPFILMHVAFNIVLYTSIAIISAMIITSFVVCPISKEKEIFKKNIKHIARMPKKNAFYTGILVICVLIQASVTSMIFSENADDSLYVSLMQQNIDSNAIYNNEPSLGDGNTIHLSNYFVQGYELSISVVSKIFNIPVTILCHTILPFILIIFSYMAYYVLLRKFLKNEKAKVALILLSILFLFSGFTVRLRGIILLSRIWQGKEIFLNIILTLILSNLVSFNKANRKKNTIKLLILNLSAVFFTNTAIFLVTFAYLGFAIIELIRRQWKNIICFIITGIPIAIYAVVYLMTATNMEAAGTVNIIDIIKDFNGTGHYYILYIISLIVILIKGSTPAKRYFILVPIIYALTIYNPLFANFIAAHFTGSNVYWRLFWLLPMEISIVYAFVILIYINNKKVYQIAAIVVEIVLIILLGKFVWTKDNGFVRPENLSKIPSQIIEQTEYILEKENENDRQIVVVAPPEPLHSATIRQLTSSINLFWSRDLYMKQIYPEEQLDEMNKIYNMYRKGTVDVSVEEFDNIRGKYGVNWIIIDVSTPTMSEYLEKTKYDNIYEVAGSFLYQY